MQQQSASAAAAAAKQRRDQMDEEDKDRRHRNRMSRFDRPPPAANPIELPEHEELGLNDSTSSWSSISDRDEDDDVDDDEYTADYTIEISNTTSKFELKQRVPCKRPPPPVEDESPGQETECDDNGFKPELLASETEDVHETQRNEFLSQLITTTTTLSPSPSPTPQPFHSPSPCPSQSPIAIDSTTTATTTTTTAIEISKPDTLSPSSHQAEDGRVSLTSRDQHQRHRHHSIVTKLSQPQLEHLDSLVDAIKQGNYEQFRQLMDKEREFNQNLLNVFVNGNTALHYSLIHGRGLKWCEQLILNGANPNLANRDGWHPMHLAAHSCTSDTLLYVHDCVTTN